MLLKQKPNQVQITILLLVLLLEPRPVHDNEAASEEVIPKHCSGRGWKDVSIHWINVGTWLYTIKMSTDKDTCTRVVEEEVTITTSNWSCDTHYVKKVMYIYSVRYNSDLV